MAVLGQPAEAWLGSLLAQLPPDIELVVLDAQAAVADTCDAGQTTLRIVADAPLPARVAGIVRTRARRLCSRYSARGAGSGCD